jgi:hypothetical protein
MNKLFSVILSVTLIAGLIWGCEKKKDNPPALPPVETMSIDFSNFTSPAKSAVTYGEVKSVAVADKTNWTVASTVAGVWNIILAVNLVIPVASFKVAVNQTPVYLDNKKWQWKYDFNVVGATYKARLTGEVRATDIKWEMYISREGVDAFAEVLWYSGTSNLDGKSGQWILNRNQTFPEPLLQIDWKTEGSDVGDIKYTYIRDNKDDGSVDLFKNSFIEYGLTTNTLNAFYNVHQNSGVANVFNDVFIEWSTTGHNGHIKANYYFKDDLWHCWNSNGENEICN